MATAIAYGGHSLLVVIAIAYGEFSNNL